MDTSGASQAPKSSNNNSNKMSPIPLDHHIASSSSTKKYDRAWWKEASVYQIYPSSFKDSNGDGIGDIPGIVSELDYLHKLGVDVVWVSPIYKSPQVDMGYDISDYKDIDTRYGTLEDVDKLVDGLHKRGMKLVMDLVVNHTSDQHEWFKQSRSSKDNKYRDWYVWKKPKYSASGERIPPNNWGACFGGSAWEYDEATDEYYLHLFAKEQPDLNWENPDVVKAVHDVIRFWLDRGCDGFRMDVINFISKDQKYPEGTVGEGPYGDGSKYYANGPRLHEYLQDMGKILKEYNAFSVGEMPCVSDEEEIMKVVGFDRGELNMIFHFEIVELDQGKLGKYSPREFDVPTLKKITKKYQNHMYDNNGWNALYTENHDSSRTVSRYCNIDSTDLSPETLALRSNATKMLSTFLAGQAGTLFVYQGQEIGMANVPHDWPITDYRDIELLNHWSEAQVLHKSQPENLKAVMAEYQKKSRDNGRTPMQWTSAPHGGFTDAKSTPWLRSVPDYTHVNANSQVDDENSPFNYWRRVLKLRKDHADELIYGDYQEVLSDDKDVIAYTRNYQDKSILVVCNWRNAEKRVKIEELGGVNGKVLLGNYDSLKVEGSDVVLRPFEAFFMNERVAN